MKFVRFDDPDLTYDANKISFDIDDEGNIYVVFEHQNRIEKYTPDGKLLFTVDRPLHYKIKHRVDNETYSIPFPVLTYVSVDLKVDNKNRFWVITYKEQPEDKGTRGATLRNHEILKFEIFSSEGILLYELPLPVRFYKMKIYGDELYLIDPYFEACIYKYKIIETSY